MTHLAVLLQTEPLFDFLIAVIIFMAGIVVTLAGIWMTNVKNAVSRDELQRAIETSLGYVRDELRAANEHYAAVMAAVAAQGQDFAALRAEWQHHKANGEFKARGHGAGE